MLQILKLLADGVLSLNAEKVSKTWVARHIGDKIENFDGADGGVTDEYETSAFILFDEQRVRFEDADERERSNSCSVARRGKMRLQLVAASRKYDAFALEERMRETLEEIRRSVLVNIQNYSQFSLLIKESNFNFKDVLKNERGTDKWNDKFAVLAIEFELIFVWNLDCPTELNCDC